MRTPEQNVVHLDGCGVSDANLLTRIASADQVHEIQARYPGRFTWFASADITKPEAGKQLSEAVQAGAGELVNSSFS